MADLRIVDAPEIPTENITGEEKLPTGGSGNYSISLDSLADYTKTKKDLADNTSVDGKVNGVRQELNTHIEDLLNPHQVTKGQIGLGNVDNTADADKPVSNSTQATIISAVAPKADKTYVDTQLTLKANKADVYTKAEAYTKQESSDLVNDSISTALTPINTSLDLAKRGIANRYDPLLTYNSGERVVLANGDIVKSTVDGNANDPNVNMTGWEKPQASEIFDASGASLQEVNDSFEFKKNSLERKILSEMIIFNKIDFDVDETITAQVSSTGNRHFKSNNHTLTQTTQRTSNLVGGYDQNNITIEGFDFVQDKTSVISGGTANDHQMTKSYGGKFFRLINNRYDGQFAISFAYGSASLPDRAGKFGLAAFNESYDLQGMFIETIGSQYNRIIGNALDSATLGQQHGIRLSGYDQINNPAESTHAPNFGQVGAANVFRKIANGVSAQNSSKYSNLSAMHFTDVDACIHATLGTVPLNDPSMHRFDFTAHNVRKLANLQYLNHTKLGFHVDGSGFTSTGIDELSGRTGTGFNHYEGLVRNAAATVLTNRYSHNLYNLQIDTSTGDGAVISGNYGGGTIIANACNTGVSITGNNNNLKIVSTNNVFTGVGIGGSSNVIEVQTDGNVSVSGNNNIITGRIGGNLTVSGSGNKFIGEVVGSVTRGSGTGNKYSDLKGWADTVVMPSTTTTGGGRITVTVDKHASAQIRNISATIPTNTNGWTSKVISISGTSVIFEFYDSSGAVLNAQPVVFNYTYFCS